MQRNLSKFILQSGAVALAASAWAAPRVHAAPAVQNIQVSRIAADSTNRVGGSGGSAYNLSCSDGQVLIGIAPRAAGYVDRMTGICQRVASTGAWIGEESFTGSAGGNGGSPAPRRCPSGYAVSGFSGRAANVVDKLVIECTKLRSDGSFDTSQRYNLTAVGGSGGTPFGTTRCAVPARAIVGKAASYIDSFELACESEKPRMTRAEIDAALDDASEILFDDSGTNDVSCDVDLRRSGRVRIEPGNGLSDISSPADISKACALLGFAVVTRHIQYCNEAVSTSIAGCATSSGCMILTPVAQANRAQLWAHKFGHTRGLPDRNGATTIMNESLNFGDTINTSECNAFRGPIGGATALAMSPQPSPVLGIRAFVSQTFFHGVPYAQSVAYGAAAVPELIALLADRSFAEHWGKIAAVLSMISAPRGIDAVIAFIERKDEADLAARQEALVSLGYAANKGDRRALAYLQESLADDGWTKRGLKLVGRERLASEAADQEADDDVGSEASMRRAAAMGLALSGSTAARASLQTAFQKGPRERELLATVLGELTKVAERGIARYDADRVVEAERALSLERSAAPSDPLPPADDADR